LKIASPAFPQPRRTLPLLDAATAFFWTAGASGRLLIQSCSVCDRYQHPPLPLCPTCHSETMAPAPVSGRGKVKTFTINHQAWSADIEVPFVFAAIELEEQPELYVLSNVIAPVDLVHAGMPVSVVFEQQGDVWLPLFRPLETQ
jgi:uncharacterized protein